MLARMGGMVLAALALAGCQTTGASRRAAVETIDRSYQTSTVAWAGGGHMLFLTKATEQEGRVRLCGAYGPANARPATAALSREVADSVALRLGGTRIAQGLGFMARHDGSRDPIGQPATCALTGVEWRPEFAQAPTYILLGRTVF